MPCKMGAAHTIFTFSVSHTPLQNHLFILEKIMKFRPLRDNVLIKRVEAKDTTAGGLILPESAKDKPQEAEVIAVGPGRTNKDGSKVPMTVNVGDLVLFKKYSTTDVKLDGDEFLILKESDILAVVEQ